MSASERVAVPMFDRPLGTSKYSHRWRRPHGRVVHAVAMWQGSGVTVVRCCEPGVVEWVSPDLIDRHLFPDSENVTCAACKKRLTRPTGEIAR